MRIERGRGGAPQRTPTSGTPRVPELPVAAAADGAPRAGLSVILEVELPSQIGYVERVVELVRRQCEEMGIGGHHLSLNIPVALSEALSNAILRGNRQQADKNVHVRAAIDARALILEIRDQGGGFDLEACLIDPTTDDNLERESGRGLFLMRSLMDHVERYDDAERRANVVRLTLRLA